MGLGIESAGRSHCGGAVSAIEPRFEHSRPLDKSKNNPRDVVLKFTTYCYSSFIYPENCVMEISEDAGFTFNPAYDGSVFLAPYDGIFSKIRRYDSQRLIFFVHKTAAWPMRKLVVIRFTAVDDYGQTATKVTPVKWD